MSTDHYSEAQQLADQAHDYTYGDGGDPVTGNALAAEAQVHATLALVDAIRERREQLHEAAREYAATHCPKCGLPTRHGQPDGEAFCDGCGWEA